MDSTDDEDAECDLMLDALHHELEQVENRLERLLSETNQPQDEFEERKNAKTSQEERKSTKQSTLPPILKQYTVKASKATQATPKTTRRRRETEILREAEEREKRREKERQRKEKNMALFEKLETLKEIVREDYLNALEEKVDRQRRKLKEREAREKQKQEIIEKKKEKKRKKKPRQPRSDGASDWSFLAHVPETQFYRLIEIEHEMKRDGKLKTGSDVRELWDRMLAPAPPKESPLKQIMPPEGSNSPSPLPVFFETDEPAIDSWAMTDVPNSMLKSDDSKKLISSSSSAVGTGAEKKFSKTSFPPLKSLEHSLIRIIPEPDPDEIKHRRKYEQRKETRKKKVKMYRHAIANRLAAARILKEHSDLFEYTPPLRAEEALTFPSSPTQLKRDSLSPRLLSTPPPPPLPSSPPSAQGSPQPQAKTHTQSVSLESELSLTSPSWGTLSSSQWDTIGLTTDTSTHTLPMAVKERRIKRKEARLKKATTTRVSEEPVPAPPAKPTLPLSMDSLYNKNTTDGVVLESKGRSGMWTNYLKA